MGLQLTLQCPRLASAHPGFNADMSDLLLCQGSSMCPGQRVITLNLLRAASSVCMQVSVLLATIEHTWDAGAGTCKLALQLATNAHRLDACLQPCKGQSRLQRLSLQNHFEICRVCVGRHLRMLGGPGRDVQTGGKLCCTLCQPKPCTQDCMLASHVQDQHAVVRAPVGC